MTVGDPDLIVECLSSVVGETMDEQSIQNLVKLLNRFPVLWDFYGVICDRAGQLDRIQMLDERADKFERAAYTCVLRSLREPDINKKKAAVAHASGFFGSARDLGNQELKVAQQLSIEFVELINLQKQLEQKAKHWPKQPCHLVNLTLAQTIKELYIRCVYSCIGMTLCLL